MNIKKLLLPFLLLLALSLSACGSTNQTSSAQSSNTQNKEQTQNKQTSQNMRIYHSQNGPVKVPAHPKRIVMLSAYPSAGYALALDANVVGVTKWDKDNPLMKKKLQDAEVVSPDNLEKIISLNPDLIIAMSKVKNLNRLKEIAPTVTYKYGKLGYLEQFKEIAKLLNQKQEALQWIKDFKQKADTIGQKIRQNIGKDATITVLESKGKQLYIYGKNFARGTEILYQEMKLNMPKKVKQATSKSGFKAISPEVIPQYVGDYLLFVQKPNVTPPFEKTTTYKQMPAVQKGHVIKADARYFASHDPLSLQYQLQFFKKAFLGK